MGAIYLSSRRTNSKSETVHTSYTLPHNSSRARQQWGHTHTHTHTLLIAECVLAPSYTHKQLSANHILSHLNSCIQKQTAFKHTHTHTTHQRPHTEHTSMSLLSSLSLSLTSLSLLVPPPPPPSCLPELPFFPGPGEESLWPTSGGEKKITCRERKCNGRMRMVASGLGNYTPQGVGIYNILDWIPQSKTA